MSRPTGVISRCCSQNGLTQVQIKLGFTQNPDGDTLVETIF